jgi:hypothetical protein
MTERARTGHGAAVSGLHLQLSKMLVHFIVAAIAATSALIVAVLVAMPPGRAPGPGPNGQPPPPPDMQSTAIFPILTGLFVLSWLAVLVVFCRDQVLARLREIQSLDLDREQLDQLLANLRTELAGDRERELRALDERLAEYGEHRETDGYLSGMRVAAAEEEPVDANVRSIRRPPAPR